MAACYSYVRTCASLQYVRKIKLRYFTQNVTWHKACVIFVCEFSIKHKAYGNFKQLLLFTALISMSLHPVFFLTKKIRRLLKKQSVKATSMYTVQGLKYCISNKQSS